MFRPFYAKHITEIGQLMLFKTIYKYNLEEDVIALATDCIYMEKSEQQKILDNSDLIDSKELGKWDKEFEGDGLFIANGMYQLSKDGKTAYKKVTRGFHKNKFPDLFKIYNEDPDQLKSKDLEIKKDGGLRLPVGGQ